MATIPESRWPRRGLGPTFGVSPFPADMQIEPAALAALMEVTDRPQLVMVRGAGSWIEDHRGKRYLDFLQGWAVNALGHCPPEIRGAIAFQSATLLNPSPAF